MMLSTLTSADLNVLSSIKEAPCSLRLHLSPSRTCSSVASRRLIPCSPLAALYNFDAYGGSRAANETQLDARAALTSSLEHLKSRSIVDTVTHSAKSVKDRALETLNLGPYKYSRFSSEESDLSEKLLRKGSPPATEKRKLKGLGKLQLPKWLRWRKKGNSCPTFLEMAWIQNLRLALERADDQVKLFEQAGGMELQDEIGERDKLNEAFKELRESFLQRVWPKLRHDAAEALDKRVHALMGTIVELEGMRGSRQEFPSPEFYERLARSGMAPNYIPTFSEAT